METRERYQDAENFANKRKFVMMMIAFVTLPRKFTRQIRIRESSLGEENSGIFKL